MQDSLDNIDDDDNVELGLDPHAAHTEYAHIKTTPLVHSYSHYSPVSSALAAEPVALGVDEAGRGPVLGPMVYAVSYTPISKNKELGKLGFADSKVLSFDQRATLFDVVLANQDWIGWAVHTCSPTDISGSMLGRQKYNLNALAHDTTINLIREVLARGVKIKEIYVDTVGPPASYQKKLEDLFPGIKVRVEKKADAKFPVVSAASICAKVTRDAVLHGWTFVERDLSISKNFGSGYPADPNTVAWMKDSTDPVFGFPQVARFSWSTCENYLQDNAVAVEWPVDDSDKTKQPAQSRSKKRAMPGQSAKASAAHPQNFKTDKTFFKRRGLSYVRWDLGTPTEP
ncbi:ribonuclease-like protein H2 large subunit [Polychytrium aggregatum]|uniref:ribonuclease-like protein H2 large subunit n=1 Tax=Polychytrium aggregatum TaxID=110093 RepID=UPI0022FE4AA3|nr:ribonuclease-like protein H2 large subunit [Polychytrium aggregatum]KAI9202596.1 ribonuclease-like protein H2 large subunit [Polychytrium aggregatum]